MTETNEKPSTRPLDGLVRLLPSERLIALAAQLPRGLRSDWVKSNHFELVCNDPDAYWWLSLSDYYEFRDDTEVGRKIGLLMDIAEELRRCLDVT